MLRTIDCDLLDALATQVSPKTAEEAWALIYPPLTRKILNFAKV
jgi:hypothetical protein